MPTPIEQNAARILLALAAVPRTGSGGYLNGPQIAEATGLSPEDINDAVEILVESGLAEWLRFFGTTPYAFGQVQATSRGRLEAQRLTQAAEREDGEAPSRAPQPGAQAATSGAAPQIIIPPTPQGSPYGFGDEHWEVVTARKADAGTLNVVMGYQFASTHYNSAELVQNVKSMFEAAIAAYLERPGALPVQLGFRPLAAGYGEHLFNEIARDIIGSDIAVFDTSDLNPNVMLEMGVALTWGVRVLPIKKEGCARPPSDLSGQTWADYLDSALRFVDPDHPGKLVSMVERAVRKKARGNPQPGA
jgi:hypothetical protein